MKTVQKSKYSKIHGMFFWDKNGNVEFTPVKDGPWLVLESDTHDSKKK